jgi:hypothetical protein
LRRIAFALLFLGAVASGFYVNLTLRPAAAAPAPSCPYAEKKVMWRMLGPQTSIARGSVDEVPVYDQAIDPCVTNRPGTGQTARVILGSVFDNWAEAGFRESKCGTAHCFDVFSEWGLNGAHHGQIVIHPGCVHPGAWMRFQTYRVPNNSYHWYGLYDCEDGNGWVRIGTRAQEYVTPYLSGVAEGEAFHRNAGSTMGGELHRRLLYLDPNYVYQLPTNVACQYDDSGSWDAVKVSNRQWNLVRGAATCG